MRAAPFLELVLWVPYVAAFYPFAPGWLQERQQARSLVEARPNVDEQQPSGVILSIDQNPRYAAHASSTWPDKAAREARRLRAKYERGQPAEPAAGHEPAAKRSNQFGVMEAARPSEPMTAGINQDGTDYSYFVQVQLGSKKKPMYMLVDTGAGSSWVMGSKCTDKACTTHNTFGPGDSDTFQPDDKDFTISYGSGTVRGKLGSDTITVAGIKFKYAFGLASKTSDDFTQFAFDGILGLSMTKGANDNFFQAMADANKLDKSIFSIALNRAADGTNKGEIKFGGVNEQRYSGDITYTPVSSGDGDWAIELDDVAYAGSKAGAGGVKSYIDTGTTFIFGPPDMVKKVHGVIPGSTSSDGQTYSVPCDSDKALTLTFSGVDYAISPKDWIAPKDGSGKCTSNIYGHEIVKGSWLVGDTFLKNVYAVFDRDQKRIGFAKMADAKTNGISSASPTGPTTTTTSGTEPTTMTTTTTTTTTSGTGPTATSDASGPATTLSTGMTRQQPGKPTPRPGSLEPERGGSATAGGIDEPQDTSSSSQSEAPPRRSRQAMALAGAAALAAALMASAM